MADIIYSAEQIRVIVRFEMWLKKFMSVHGHFIFVRIYHQCSRMIIQSFYTFKQSMLCQFIIMICKGNKITGCSFYGTVRVLRNLECAVMMDYFDP